MTKKVHTVESSDRNEFDRIINIMVNQGWELTGSNNIPGKYSQTLSYHYNDDDELEFYENGFVEFHRIYKSDTEESKIYFKNGNLNWNENWKDGDRHGKWKEYYDNGNIKVDTNFSNGIIKGHIEIKTKDGDIILSSHNIDMDGIVSKTNGNEEDVEETIIENYGDITIYSEGNRYTGELHVFDFDYDEHDEVIEETVHEFFEKLLNRRKENSNIGLIFMNDVSHQYGKYWEEIFIPHHFDKRTYNLPRLYCQISHVYGNDYIINISSFDENLKLFSKSEFEITILEYTVFRLIPTKVEFIGSKSTILKYENVNINENKMDEHSFTMGHRNGRNINYETKFLGRKGLENQFFSIGGILTFFHKGEKIIETKNMLLNNPHYNGYVLDDKTIEWSIYDQDCIYERGFHNLKKIHNKDEIKLEHEKRFLKVFGDKYGDDRSLNSCENELFLYDREGKLIYKDSFFRDQWGKSKSCYEIEELLIERLFGLFQSPLGSFTLIFRMIFNEWKLKNDFFWEFKWSYNDINNDCFDEEENRHNYTYDLNVKDIMKIESNMVEGMKERKSFTDNKSNKE